MDDHLTHVAEAFTRKALIYDAFGLDHENLSRMRRKVHAHVLSYLRAGDHILELNAGTGSDAVFFAQSGYQVHAIDISPGMIAQIEAKTASHELQGKITTQQCSFTELDKVNNAPFDYALSNMGGINCHADLSSIASGLRQVLRPSAIVTWVVMPPICLWELAQVLKVDLRTATRRLAGKTFANVEGVHFYTYYFTPTQIKGAFGSDFLPLKLQGLSVFTPTADMKDFPTRHARLYRLLRWIDESVSDIPPFSRWGDFFILTMQYQPK